ncbi:MAG: prepilin-type N-terminal cleavage/methylation domain-containing protein [Tissierellia bacterium]|nr:prepilin-type N-terminal cleavage/methylation domain-containing protein [Tissierellia bacterium]
MKNKKGFTLIELIVTLSVLSIVFTLIYSLFSANIKASETIYKNSFTETNAKNAILYIENTLRRSIYTEEILDDECNFFTVIKNNDNTYSAITFGVENENLYRYSKNLGNYYDQVVDLSKMVKNKIASNVSYIEFIKEDTTVQLEIMFIPENTENLYQTSINLGE